MKDLSTRIISGLIYLFLIWLAITYSKESFTILFIIIGMRCLYEMFLLRKNKTKIIPLLYISLPFILVHPLAFLGTEFDSNLVLGIFVLTWIFDSFCYIIGVPFGAAKSVPVCILVKPSIGCFRLPKEDESLAPFIGVFIKVFFTLFPFSSK